MEQEPKRLFTGQIRELINKKKGLISLILIIAIVDSAIPVVQVSILGYLVMQLISGAKSDVALFLVMYLFTYFAQHFSAYCKNKAQLKLKLDFAHKLEEEVIQKVAKTSLNTRLQPKFNDSFTAVQNALSPGQISNMIVLMIESLIILLTVIFIIINLMSVSIVAPLIVLILLIFVFPLQIKANNIYRDRVLFGHIREQNIISALENDIFSRQGFIEMNIMGYYGWIKNIWLNKFRAFRKIKTKEEIKLQSLNHLLSTFWHVSPVLVVLIVMFTNQISLSQLVILFGSMYYLIPRISSAVETFTQLQHSLGLFRKVIAFMDEHIPTAKHVLHRATEPQFIKGSNISFAYPDQKNILSNVNFKLNKGDVVCIVGENGSGKSTLVKLITGLLDPSEGMVEFDERCKVPQGSAFFQNFIKLEETIRDNVAIGTENLVSDEQIYKALKAAKGDFAIESGLDTLLDVDMGGINISGGQWQRLGLARTFIKENGIIILDEPTASLDPLAEIELYTSVIDKYSDRTIILVSHRLTATLLADQILVVSEGGITEVGTHQQLMKQEGLYHKFFNVQAMPYLNYYRDKKRLEAN